MTPSAMLGLLLQLHVCSALPVQSQEFGVKVLVITCPVIMPLKDEEDIEGDHAPNTKEKPL